MNAKHLTLETYISSCMSLILSPSNNFISNTFRTIDAPLRRGKGYPRREVKSIQGQRHPSMLPWTYNEYLDERLALNSWCLFFWTSKSEFKHYKQSIRSINFVTLKIIATVKPEIWYPVMSFYVICPFRVLVRSPRIKMSYRSTFIMM